MLTPKTLSAKSYGAIVGLMVLATLPARLARFRASLWLDEAWVANSLLTPTLSQMLHFDRWVQSTPPLFLLLERMVGLIAGYSEPVLRLLPLLASLLGLVLLAMTLRRLFTPVVALVVFSLIVSNFWVINYSQQLKQFGTDFLTACLLILLMQRVLFSAGRLRDCFPLCIFCGLSTFFSFISVFWFASCLVAIALPGSAPALPGGPTRRPHYYRALAFAVLTIGCVALNYCFFIRPNRTTGLSEYWAHAFVDLSRPQSALAGFQHFMGALFIPSSSKLATLDSWLLEGSLIYGAYRAAGQVLVGDRKALVVLLAGLLPIVVAIFASSLRLYPILHPRLLLWVAPGGVLLLGSALTPGIAAGSSWTRLVQMLPALAAVACLAAVELSGEADFFAYQHPADAENNRDAVDLIRSHWHDSDILFVHGGMSEQFFYYRHLFGWNPAHVYLGNTDWPCCPLNLAKRTSTPAAQNFFEDLTYAVTQARGHSLWLLLPAAPEGTWWHEKVGAQINGIPRWLDLQGCREDLNQSFGYTLVLESSCP